MAINLIDNQAFFTGMHPRVLLKSLIRVPGFIRDAYTYNRKRSARSLTYRLADLFPILTENRADAGSASGPYFHQDLWAAKKIFERKPSGHIDIGSRIDGFIAHLLVFMPVTVVDIRALTSQIPGLTFMQDDATTLDKFQSNQVDSISTLHVAEHFGLGRYGDGIDPDACFKFMDSLKRVLAPAGRLYFSVPIGRERVEFNAHRVFAVNTILRTFEPLHLVSFSYVGDDGNLQENVSPAELPELNLGCGLFEFIKHAS